MSRKIKNRKTPEQRRAEMDQLQESISEQVEKSRGRFVDLAPGTY